MLEQYEEKTTGPFFDSIIISDSGWTMNLKTSKPHRGIRDYERTVRFKYEPKAQEILKAIEEWISYKKPGWTPLITQKITSTTWKFYCTEDSSD
jgi:hypothetical protein